MNLFSEFWSPRDATRPVGSLSRDVREFRRNPNLSHIVHALLHLSQFMIILAIEVFHHVHEMINTKLRTTDPTIPELPEKRHPIYPGLFINMLISLILAIIWVIPKDIPRKIEMGLIGCSAGAILTFLNAIFSMRHAQLYINIEEVSDAQLIKHPIFVHSFTICILAIFALSIYILHFWLLYECWRWKRIVRKLISMNDKIPKSLSRRMSSKFSDSSDSSDDIEQISERSSISAFSLFGFSDVNVKQSMEIHDHVKQRTIDDEPVTLYCFCIDCWHYIQYLCNKQKSNFQPHDVDNL